MTGILTELQAESDRINSIIIGIGMNVNQEEIRILKSYGSIATSLFIETGKKINRAELIRHVLINLEHLYDLI